MKKLYVLSADHSHYAQQIRHDYDQRANQPVKLCVMNRQQAAQGSDNHRKQKSK
jgi:hypothetical protein